LRKDRQSAFPALDQEAGLGPGTAADVHQERSQCRTPPKRLELPVPFFLLLGVAGAELRQMMDIAGPEGEIGGIESRQEMVVVCKGAVLPDCFMVLVPDQGAPVE